MIWSVNEQNSEMSPKQILSKEATCKGIYLLYAGDWKKATTATAAQKLSCCWVYIHRRKVLEVKFRSYNK